MLFLNETGISLFSLSAFLLTKTQLLLHTAAHILAQIHKIEEGIANSKMSIFHACPES